MKICRFCGKELADDTLFCVRCGKSCEDIGEQAAEKVPEQAAAGTGGQMPEETQNVPEETQDVPGQEEGEGSSGAKKKFLLPVAAGGILLAAAVAGGTFWGVAHFRGGGPASLPEREQAEEDAIFDLSQAELLENYQPPEKSGTVDLGARDHQPTARDTSALWDKGLFYYLEDVGEGDDNHIAECLLSRMELVREDNGTPVEYEVYRDPESRQIQKIVSIEPGEDGTLALSDYYYQDGTPNFVFRRNDSVYTPSYATIDKTGERYYFFDDQMVKWRWIYEPSVVKQWILEPEDTWYTQWGYMEISDNERAQYDDKEMQVLNEAYNTYEAVLANEEVPVIWGCVTDEDGRPLENVEVGIGKVADGEIENPGIKVKTDKEGQYAWAPGQEDGSQGYFLVFRKEGWIPSLMKISDGGAENGMLQAAQEDMILQKDGEDGEVSVTFQVYQVDARDGQGMEESEEEAFPALPGAAVSVYRGMNWFFDDPVEEAVSSSDGTVSLELPKGLYTAVIEKEGFLPFRKTVLAGGREEKHIIYSLSQAGSRQDADEWRILLDWDSSETGSLDLDSSLFTPEKAAKGDRSCIYTLNRDDHAGARFLYDGKGKNACEMIALADPKRGSYKYYVSNYTDIQSGNAGSMNLAKSGARVTVFHNGIPIKTFPVPDKAGAVWEVFELREQGIVPIQEVYENTAGKGWWTEDKQLARLSERSITADWIQSDGEWLYFLNPADQWKLYYCRKDGSDLTKLSDEGIDGRFLLIDDYLYCVSGFSIIKLKTDGTGREIIQTWIPGPLEDYTDGLYLVAYADGMLYYYTDGTDTRQSFAIPLDAREIEDSAWSSLETADNWTAPYCRYGQRPKKAAVVGNYLYYVDEVPAAGGAGTYSFCRKDLQSGEEQCVWPEFSCFPWSWKIYRGWIYYTDNGVVKRAKITDPGVSGGGQVLAENGINCGIELDDMYMGTSCYYLMPDGNNCYYLGNDGQVYVMDLDGSGQRVLPLSGQYAAILDGEIYTREDSSVSPITVGDKDGKGSRLLFDSAPLLGLNARQAYAAYLETYNPVGSEESYSWPSFACQDIDGDGIPELFVSYAFYQHQQMDYYRYNGWGIQTVWQAVSGDEIVFNLEAQEISMLVSESFWDQALERYRMDGGLIQSVEFHFGGADHDAQLAAYDAMYDTYIAPYPTLDFVENTPENRQKYLLGNLETGWAD